jgi:hypothetical protein
MLYVHAHSFQPRFQNQTFLDLGEVHDSSKALMVKKPRSIVGFYLPASRLIPMALGYFKTRRIPRALSRVRRRNINRLGC